MDTWTPELTRAGLELWQSLLALLPRGAAALVILLCGAVCFAGQPHGGDQTGGGMLMRPDDHEGHNHNVDFDERTMRIASEVICPEHCGG